MALLFNPTGRLLVLTPHADKNYAPATISIPTIGTDCPANSVFVTSYTLDKRVIYSLQRTLRNDLYFYSTGSGYEPMVIEGIAFNPDSQCGGSESETGVNILWDWFNSRMAYLYSNYMQTISITLGDSTLSGLLVGIKATQPDPSIELFKFVAIVEPLSIS